MSSQTPEAILPIGDTAPVRELAQERAAIVGKIPEVLQALPAGESTIVNSFGQTDGGRNLDLTVSHKFKRGGDGARMGDRNGFDTLDIAGSETSPAGEAARTFPMYRITRHVPATDMGNMATHYEISVADSDSANGYRPLALVMQSILGSAQKPRYEGSPRTNGYGYGLFEQSTDQLSPTERIELQTTGLFVNPSDEAKLAEVQTISALIITQAGASPDQPTLPIPFQSVS
jgi:hypothetical protein